MANLQASDPWTILSLSNPSAPQHCSIHFEPYSATNPVVMYSTCSHVICNQCYEAAVDKKKCQMCGKTNGWYGVWQELTNAAICIQAK